MSEREEAMRGFLKEAGWKNATLSPMPGDASTRRYLRVSEPSRHAMLMDQPQGAESPACPPGASAEERRALGYNAIARLAGADCARFIAVAHYLRERGLSAPETLRSRICGAILSAAQKNSRSIPHERNRLQLFRVDIIF